MMYSMTSKGQFENLTSGQGHDLSLIGHVAYQSICVLKINTMDLISNLYVSIKILSQVIAKKLSVTYDDVT